MKTTSNSILKQNPFELKKCNASTSKDRQAEKKLFPAATWPKVVDNTT
jgi:hypothetical protein